MESNKNHKNTQMAAITFHPIGIIRSPFKEAQGTPIQPTAEGTADGVVEIYPEFREGLEDLDGFSHIILLYYFHQARHYSLKVKPFLDKNTHGLFATRAPARPNAIGISVVRLLEVRPDMICIGDADMLDGTPLLDIKPYVPEFDVREVRKTGWFELNPEKFRPEELRPKGFRKIKDDGRFSR